MRVSAGLRVRHGDQYREIGSIFLNSNQRATLLSVDDLRVVAAIGHPREGVVFCQASVQSPPRAVANVGCQLCGESPAPVKQPDLTSSCVVQRRRCIRLGSRTSATLHTRCDLPGERPDWKDHGCVWCRAGEAVPVITAAQAGFPQTSVVMRSTRSEGELFCIYDSDHEVICSGWPRARQLLRSRDRHLPPC